MRTLLIPVMIATSVFTLQGAPLKVVEVAAPAINCVFNRTCRVTVSDSVGSIALAGGATGRLQSRTYRGGAGAPAAGRNAYEYRVDLTDAVGVTGLVCVSSLSVNFGPIIPIDFNGDGQPDQVFVVTRGGLGSIGLGSAEQTGRVVTFNFRSPVCPGGRPGGGQTSFFFGLVAAKAPRQLTATLATSSGAVRSAARAPAP